MKKIIFVITLALSAVFFGCGEDDLTTLRWYNDSGNYVSDIKWIDTEDKVDAEWGGVPTPDEKPTEWKKINKLYGHGEAFFPDDGRALPIVVDDVHSSMSGIVSVSAGGSDVEIEKNVDATLVIDKSLL